MNHPDPKEASPWCDDYVLPVHNKQKDFGTGNYGAS
jgi:hypothetical protein